MEIRTLAGNAPIREQLSRREPGHAYILSGPRGSGRHTLARELCAALVCAAPPRQRPCGVCPGCRKAAAGIHPDVITVAGEGDRPITVDQVRRMRADAGVRPNEAPRKVYVLEQAHRMNAAAQNAMLKLLEEGPAYAAFLLLCENAGGLLPTVRSRCQELALLPLSLEECRRELERRLPELSRQARERYARESQGLLGRALELAAREGREDELEQRAAELARLLETGSEGELLARCLELEGLKGAQLQELLERARVRLGERAGACGDRARLLRAAALLEELERAAQANVGAGQLLGWLCAGMFETRG